jgi:NAD(P)-dependent dehydrogenase (short-subunit alcohol dehydrogenase family)
MADLTGKRVIVTGGSTGIGAAIAERFLADGAKVCIWGQSKERLAAMTAKLPQLSAESVDVADADAVDTAFERSRKSLGGLDVLICNAGISIRHDFVDIERKDFERILKVNLFGAFFVSQLAARHMLREGGGAILFTASTSGVIGYRHYADYNASKGAMIALMRTMAGAGAQGARQRGQPRLYPDTDAGGGVQPRHAAAGERRDPHGAPRAAGGAGGALRLSGLGRGGLWDGAGIHAGWRGEHGDAGGEVVRVV